MARLRFHSFALTLLWMMTGSFLYALAGPKRVISLAPSLTESACAAGLCDSLVGVTDFCIYPQQVNSIAKVGGYLNPNEELIVSLKPDLILALPEHRDVTQRLTRLGLEVTTLRNWSIEDIWQTIADLGRLAGDGKQAAGQANQLLDRLKKRQQEYRRWRKRGIPCLLAIGHDGREGPIREVYAVGNNGFLNEMLMIAGGTNVFTKEKPYFPKLDQEALISLAPEVIINLIPEDDLSEEEIQQTLKRWQSITHLPAVKQQKVFVIHRSDVLQAGPRYIETLAAITKILDGQ